MVSDPVPFRFKPVENIGMLLYIIANAKKGGFRIKAF